jgi:hypothetical protein
MPVDKVKCPKCHTVLRPTKPLTPGKAVKCPKCGAGFTAPKDEEEILDVVALQPAEPAPKPPQITNPTLLDEEDDGPATYSFVNEPEEPPKKPARRSRYDDDDDDDEFEEEKEGADDKVDISIVPDLTVKDPRGIAQEIVIRPTNWLMLVTVIDIVCTLVFMAYFLIPIFFSLPPDTDRVSTVNPGSPGAAAAQAKETAKQGGGTLSWDTGTSNFASWLVVLVVFVIGGIDLVFNGAIISGCVRTQNLESYGWCIAACIMAMIPIGSGCFLTYIVRLLLGVVCLITLRRADVIAGFNYRAE